MKATAQIYEVGGCVRDRFLGLDSKDIDFTYVSENSNQTLEEGFAEMKQFLKDKGFYIFLEVPDMVTIRAKFPPLNVDYLKYQGLSADFVLARREVGYAPDSRRPIVELGTLEDDLTRRDFTINAMAESTTGELIDPFNGKKDLHERYLRTPRDPILTLLDDPLRLLRAVRFSVTKDMMYCNSLCNTISSLDDAFFVKFEKTVSIERVREELNKAFKHDTTKTLRKLSWIDRENKGKLMPILFRAGLRLECTTKL
jgi:poly(A) polymerase